jgi:hypothetical protein
MLDSAGWWTPEKNQVKLPLEKLQKSVEVSVISSFDHHRPSHVATIKEARSVAALHSRTHPLRYYFLFLF